MQGVRAVLRRVALTGLALLAAVPALAGEISGSELATLARCISESGALFYGAHWCPYCRVQKEYFGASADLLPYVECYDGRKADGINALCGDEGIKTFPTWRFPDGRVVTGARSPSQLAADSGC